MAHDDKTDAQLLRETTLRQPTLAVPRRLFLRTTLVGAAATGLLGFGCGDDVSSETSGTGSGGGASSAGPTTGSGSSTAGSTTDASASTGTPATTTTGGEGGSGDGGAGPVTSSSSSSGDGGGGGGPTPTCEETEADIEGPYYTEDAPFVEDALPGVGEVDGVLLRLSGRVFSAGSCAPLADAVLDIWQADDDGAYDGQGFTLRGKVRTDAEGRYEIDTIVPGHYLNGAQYRPAHIHVKVSAPGHALLTTQLYFPDNPYNEIDPWFDERLLIDITPGKGLDFGAFDFTIVES